MIDLLLAPNPGPMTLDGTNTYLIGDLSGPRVVIDPGPIDDRHLSAIIDAAPAGISEIWLTHHHHDHLDAVPELARRTGALARAWRTPSELGVVLDRFEPLIDDQQLTAGEVQARVTHIPGHTSDSIGFVLTTPAGESALVTGDMVLGRGTTVIMHPDGNIADYLNSLQRMQELIREHSVTDILPGHGPRLADPLHVLADYLEHRQARLDQVRLALDQGAESAEQVVDVVYADIDPRVRPAALSSVQAQLAYLEAR